MEEELSSKVGEVGASRVNPLLGDPTDDQRAVLSVIHGELEASRRWPIWQFVDLSVTPYGTAAPALASMPRLRDSRYSVGAFYGWVWHENYTQSPSANTQVALTVAGLNALRYDDLPKLYLRLVAHCIEMQRRLMPSPTKPVYATVMSDDLQEAVLPDLPPSRDRAGLAATRIAQLSILADHEPPTVGRVSRFQDGTWSITVPPEIVTYAGVSTVEQYLARVAEQIEPPAPPFARSIESPFSIPEMVSFLDATWMAKFDRPLFDRVDAAGAASLLCDARTPDEFDGRLSALAHILSRIDVPPDDGLRRNGVRLIVLLGRWLKNQLDEAAGARVVEAATTLSKIVNIRVGGQHLNERHKVVAVFEEFGLQYPPVDWSLTWATIRGSAVNALDAIRQEVAAGIDRRDPATGQDH